MTTRFDPSDSHVRASLTGAGWQPIPPATLSAMQKDWLTRGGSLTRHLSSLGAVAVAVVDERVGLGWPDEVSALGVSVRTPLWVREVVLSVDGVAMVAAHSIAPLKASHGIWQAMRSLGTRPLAELLYADRTVERSVLVSRRVTARHPLHRFAANWSRVAPHALLARRSIFVRAHAPLMVTECMLPALWDKLAARHHVSADHPHGVHHVAPLRLGTRLAQAASDISKGLLR